MTTDAGQRLIEDLRDLHTAFDGTMSEEGRETLLAVAAELERLRGVEADALRYRYVRDAGQRDYGVLCEQRSNVYLKFGRRLDNAIDAAIAASRSTGAADAPPSSSDPGRADTTEGPCMACDDPGPWSDSVCLTCKGVV